MKKTSFLKKLTAMAATLAMTCVMAVGAFAAEPAVDYKLDSAAISVGETWTMSVPAGGMYDWNLSSEYIAYGPSMADKEGVLKQVGYETANGVSTITYEAMMPGTCTVTLTDRSFAKIAEATVTVTDGSAAPDTPSVDTPSTDNKAAETPAASSAPSAAAAVSTAPVDTRTAQQREIDEAKANGTWGIEYTTCQKCGYHNWTRKGNVYVCDTCGNETTTVGERQGRQGLRRQRCYRARRQQGCRPRDPLRQRKAGPGRRRCPRSRLRRRCCCVPEADRRKRSCLSGRYRQVTAYSLRGLLPQWAAALFFFFYFFTVSLTSPPADPIG